MRYDPLNPDAPVAVADKPARTVRKKCVPQNANGASKCVPRNAKRNDASASATVRGTPASVFAFLLGNDKDAAAARDAFADWLEANAHTGDWRGHWSAWLAQRGATAAPQHTPNPAYSPHTLPSLGKPLNLGIKVNPKFAGQTFSIPAVHGVVTAANSFDESAPIKVGDIMYASWGYEQTNIDWFKVVKRSGDMLTLQPLDEIAQYNERAMTSITMPGEPTNGNTIRRKVAQHNGKDIGCKFQNTYGWISRWDGKPQHASHYA